MKPALQSLITDQQSPHSNFHNPNKCQTTKAKSQFRRITKRQIFNRMNAATTCSRTDQPVTKHQSATISTTANPSPNCLFQRQKKTPERKVKIKDTKIRNCRDNARVHSPIFPSFSRHPNSKCITSNIQNARSQTRTNSDHIQKQQKQYQRNTKIKFRALRIPQGWRFTTMQKKLPGITVEKREKMRNLVV